jgi:hypothetical protein
MRPAGFSANDQVQVDSVALAKTGSGTSFSIVIRNIWLSPLDQIDITLADEAVYSTPQPLQPDRTLSLVQNGVLSGSYEAGQNYQITVAASYDGGKTSTLVLSVVCVQSNP